MPYVQIRLNAPQCVHHPRLAAQATRLMVEVMRKQRALTVVEIVTPTSLWSGGGQPVAGPLAQVDVKITAGTNSETDKARLLAEFHALLTQELGPLAAPAYVVIDEIPATDWGYDGLSQASRLSRKSGGG